MSVVDHTDDPTGACPECERIAEKKCRVCDQDLRPLPLNCRDHHLNPSPYDPGLCMGCWIGWLEMEKFLIRARPGRMQPWSLQVMDAMKAFLGMFP